MSMKPKDWLTVVELQKYIKSVGRHWSRTYIQFLITNNKLKSFKISAARLFVRSDVDTFLSSLKRKAPPVLIKK